MTEPSPAPHGADSRRHMLVGDVHLLLINPAGEVLFEQRQNTGYEDGAWHLPSGHLEAGESVVAALIRESREEIGVIIDEQEVEFCHVMHNSSGGGRAAFFFAVHRWIGEPTNLEPDKCSGLDWFSPSALPCDLIPYCRAALEWIAANHCFSVYGW
jgi:8-oxo-dGTP diphosphatase